MFQGSILILQRYKKPVNLTELGKLCEQYGEIKNLRGCKDSR